MGSNPTLSAICAEACPPQGMSDVTRCPPTADIREADRTACRRSKARSAVRGIHYLLHRRMCLRISGMQGSTFERSSLEACRFFGKPTGVRYQCDHPAVCIGWRTSMSACEARWAPDCLRRGLPCHRRWLCFPGFEHAPTGVRALAIASSTLGHEASEDADLPDAVLRDGRIRRPRRDFVATRHRSRISPTAACVLTLLRQMQGELILRRRFPIPNHWIQYGKLLATQFCNNGLISLIAEFRFFREMHMDETVSLCQCAPGHSSAPGSYLIFPCAASVPAASGCYRERGQARGDAA